MLEETPHSLPKNQKNTNLLRLIDCYHRLQFFNKNLKGAQNIIEIFSLP
jgi:hypothetical protein